MKMAIEKAARPARISSWASAASRGRARSVMFCHKIGLDYVSCSPYRVPIAKLAAAHAALKDKVKVKRWARSSRPVRVRHQRGFRAIGTPRVFSRRSDVDQAKRLCWWMVARKRSTEETRIALLASAWFGEGKSRDCSLPGSPRISESTPSLLYQPAESLAESRPNRVHPP